MIIDNDLIFQICNGDLDKLKTIPTNKFSKEFSLNLIYNMEHNMQNFKNMMNDCYSYDNNDLIQNFIYKINCIEKCITYIKKIM
jgi:hypothetical protein